MCAQPRARTHTHTHTHTHPHTHRANTVSPDWSCWTEKLSGLCLPISCQLEGRTCPHKGVEQLMDAVVPGVQLQQFPAFMEHFAYCRVFSLIISLTDLLIFSPYISVLYKCASFLLFHCFLLSFCSHDAFSVVDLRGGDLWNISVIIFSHN